MLLLLVIVALAATFLSWGLQALWALRLALCYPPRSPVDPDEAAWPEVAVLLPLRGSDPVLGECLRGLCQQDYPSYQIRIIVDSAQDPAWEAVHEILAEFPSVRISAAVLETPLATCSLKVSALLQATADLDESIAVVAQIDADVVPPPGWLRELARPFRDPKVGAVSGLRWYHTHCTAWGSLVRGLWGAMAAIQMYSLDILWGGSLALRASLLREPRLRELWARSFVEDTSVVAHLRQQGLRLHVLPRLTLLNPESISLPGCFRFIRRQVLCVRLHHPAWRHTLLITLGLAISPLLAGLAALACWWHGAEHLSWGVLGALGGSIVATGLALMYVDGYFYYTAPEDKPLAPLRWKHIPVIPLTMIVHLAAVLSACRLREIDWRGVRYVVEGPESIRRLDYAPYTDAPASPEQAQSIL